MAESENPVHSLMPLLIRFSAESATIRRLVLSDEVFRSVVEDYLLAHKTLQKLQKQTPSKVETLDEYKTILRDLETEINKSLIRLRGESF